MTAEHLDGPAALGPSDPGPAELEPEDRFDVSPVPLADFGAGDARTDARPLRLLAGVQVELTVELGRSRLPVQDLLTLAPGAVVELDRPADATVDILVNGTVVARGEVVVVDGDFGVRISEIRGSD
jgi:flagellar motor switch protein FliN/FliY